MYQHTVCTIHDARCSTKTSCVLSIQRYSTQISDRFFLPGTYCCVFHVGIASICIMWQVLLCDTHVLLFFLFSVRLSLTIYLCMAVCAMHVGRWRASLSCQRFCPVTRSDLVSFPHGLGIWYLPCRSNGPLTTKAHSRLRGSPYLWKRPHGEMYKSID